MENTTLQFLITIAGSGAFFSFLQFLISRHDKKFQNEIENKLNKMSEDISFVKHGCTRTQLMVLMKMFSNRHEEIIKVAYSYFCLQKGDWYMTTLFRTWLREKGIEEPDWFKETL